MNAIGKNPEPMNSGFNPWQKFWAYPIVRAVLGVLLVMIFIVGFISLSQFLGLRLGVLAAEMAAAISAVVVVIFVASKFERRAPKEVGFDGDGALRQFGVGCAIGAGLMVVVAGVLATGGWYRLDSVADPGDVAKILAFSIPFLLAVSVFEETLLRGLLLRVLEEQVGTVGALVFSGGIFGLIHVANPNAELGDAAAIAVEAGLLLGAAFILTRSLWMAFGIHFTWNLVQGPILGMSVSGTGDLTNPFGTILRSVTEGPEVLTGGAFGPEGGLVAVTLGAAAGLWMLFKANREGKFVSFEDRTKIRPYNVGVVLGSGVADGEVEGEGLGSAD